jgi:ribonuclease P protein component
MPAGSGETASRWIRERRLRSRADFLRVQRTGVRVTSPSFVLLLAPGAKPGPFRAGITVTRKVGNAVVRNRAKRLLREALRRMSGLSPDGIDMVVVVRAPLEGMKAQDVAAELGAVARFVSRRARALLDGGAPEREACA